MKFTRKFLRNLQKKLTGSGPNLYRMTKQNVDLLLKSKQLLDSDKNVIYDAIRNDVYRNYNHVHQNSKHVHQKEDPLFLEQFWDENINDSNFSFLNN
jgi:hypothetical protein